MQGLAPAFPANAGVPASHAVLLAKLCKNES